MTKNNSGSRLWLCPEITTDELAISSLEGKRTLQRAWRFRFGQRYIQVKFFNIRNNMRMRKFFNKPTGQHNQATGHRQSKDTCTGGCTYHQTSCLIIGDSFRSTIRLHSCFACYVYISTKKKSVRLFVYYYKLPPFPTQNRREVQRQD